jgi:hypothetical protein
MSWFVPTRTAGRAFDASKLQPVQGGKPLPPELAMRPVDLPSASGSGLVRRVLPFAAVLGLGVVLAIAARR